MSQRPPAPSDAAIAASLSKKLSLKRSSTRFAVCSLPIGKVARWLVGLTVEVMMIASRPPGLFGLLKQDVEKLCQLVLTFGGLAQEGGDVDFFSVDAVTGPAHIATLAFVFDEKAIGIRIEHQSPPVLVGAFSALIYRPSQCGHVDFPLLQFQPITGRAGVRQP